MVWEPARLGDVAEIVGGSTPSTSVEEFWGGDIPWVTPADLTRLSDPTISKTPRTLTPLGLAKSGAKVLPIGAVLFSSRAPIGHVAITGVPMATNQGFKSFVPNESRLYAKFLYWWLRSNKEFLQGLGVGATFKEVSKAIVAEVQIPLPPLPEQRRIASILDEASDLRAIRARSLEHLSRLVDSDFEARFGNVLSEDRGWRIGHVGDLVTSFSSGRSIVGVEGVEASKYRVLKISAVTKGSFAPTETKALPPGYEPPEQHLVRQGDLLISRANTRELVGATAMVREPVSNLALPDKLWRFNWREGEGSPSSYVWRAFSRPEFRKALGDIATGSGGSMKNISQSAVLGMRLAIPPRNIRDEYQGVLEEFDSLRRRAEIDLAMLDELFASLQHRAFRGEL